MLARAATAEGRNRSPGLLSLDLFSGAFFCRTWPSEQPGRVEVPCQRSGGICDLCAFPRAFRYSSLAAFGHGFDYLKQLLAHPRIGDRVVVANEFNGLGPLHTRVAIRGGLGE